MGKLKVFLADWQVLFREGVHFTLCGEEDMEVVGEGTSSEEALNFVESNSPDVAILSMKNGRRSGAAATRCIKRNTPSVSVILVTDINDEEHLFSALKCGAHAYLTKDIDPVDLVSIIRRVGEGSHPISEALLMPGIASQVINDFEFFASIDEPVNCLFARLSSIEADILYRIAKGSSIEQIVGNLGVTKESMDYHFGLILSKLVANDHSREIIEAAQRGLPSIPSVVGPPVEYITRAEFGVFKENLGERLKSLVSELGPEREREAPKVFDRQIKFVKEGAMNKEKKPLL